MHNLSVDACVVSVSAGSREEAERVADALLDARLAACVQIVGPVESHYWWQDRRESATEWLCVVKTRLTLVDAVAGAVRSVHTYDTPEVVAVPVVAGDAAYLAWLEETASGGGDA